MIDKNFMRINGAFRQVGAALLAFSLVPTFFVLPSAHAQNSEVQTKRYKPELVVQTGHSSDISSIAFSPNGKIVASGSFDNTIKLWDKETGKELRTLYGHTGRVLSVAFSPDGQTLASGGWFNVIRLWDVASGKQIGALEGHTDQVNSVVFSPNGTSIASCGNDDTARLWNLQTRKQLQQFDVKEYGTAEVQSAADPGTCQAVSFSPTGDILAFAGRDDRTVALWGLREGRLLRTLSGNASPLHSLIFTPDGKRLVCGDREEVNIWDVNSGNLVTATETDPTEETVQFIRSVAVSRDGKTIAGVQGNTIRLWHSEDGRKIKDIRSEGDKRFLSVAFGADENTLATSENTELGGGNDLIRLWNITNGRETIAFDGYSNNAFALSLSPDGKHLAVWDPDSTLKLKLWNFNSDKPFQSFESNDLYALPTIMFGPDSTTLAIGTADKVILRDSASGKISSTLTKPRPWAGFESPPLTFTSDGKIVSLGWAGGLSVWDSKTGKVIRSIQNYGLAGWKTPPNTVAISLNGNLLVGGGLDGSLRLWDLRTGKARSTSCGASDPIDSVAFSPNGKLFEAVSRAGDIKICNAGMGNQLREFKNDTIQKAVFSPDSRALAGISYDGSITLWDIQSGGILKTFPGASRFRSRNSLAFSPDGRTLFSTSGRSIKLWNINSGKEIATFVTIGKTDWAVVTPDGYFDASDGAQALMHFVINDPGAGYEALSLDQIKSHRWDPGLLKKIIDGEPLPSTGELSVTLFPDVRIDQAASGSPSVKIDLKNRGGGIGRVEVRVNGGELTPDASAGRSIDRLAGAAQLTVNIPKDRLRPGDNEIDVVTWNIEGDVQSNNYPVFLNLADNGFISKGATLTGNKVAKPPSEIDYYAIVSGISNYSGPINLRYSAKDAEDMARALTLAARRYFCADEIAENKPCLRVHITLLSTETDEKVRFDGQQYVPDFQRLDPVKASYEKVFADVAGKAKADDVVTVYFSGHATTINTDEAVRESAIADTYLYATRDATTLASSALANETERAAKTVSSLELAKWLSEIKAEKKVLVLDTCAAGAVQKDLAEVRAGDSLQTRSIERLRTRTGFFVLMGSAGNAQSFEANQYRQGLLTYSLLEGMTVGGKLAPGGFVDVDLLLSSAKNRVEDLAKGLGDIQVPMYWRPGLSESFDIGRIEDEERKLIPIATPVPIILQPFLFEKVENSNVINDAEGLTEKLKAALLERSLVNVRGQGAAINYVDTTNANGVRPNGSYTVNGDQITIVVTLIKDKKPFAEVTAAGTRDNVIENLVREILKALPA